MMNKFKVGQRYRVVDMSNTKFGNIIEITSVVRNGEIAYYKNLNHEEHGIRKTMCGTIFANSLELIIPFKVGDTVVAKRDTPYKITTNGWTGTVIELCSDGDMIVRENGYAKLRVNPKWFDKVPEQKIVITVKGNRTIAILYSDDKPIKTASAKCNPEDTFDFEVGAKLVTERLFENPETFYNGKICVTAIMGVAALTVGKIYTFKDGRFYNDNGDKFPGRKIHDINELTDYLRADDNNDHIRLHYALAHIHFVEVVE